MGRRQIYPEIVTVIHRYLFPCPGQPLKEASAILHVYYWQTEESGIPRSVESADFPSCFLDSNVDVALFIQVLIEMLTERDGGLVCDGILHRHDTLDSAACKLRRDPSETR